jgi:DHA3 family macrolide efflux protein-like MFS transporter
MTEKAETRDSGGRFKHFFILWSGQVLSLFGSGLTGFAVGVWVYESRGSVTDFTLIFAFGAVPGLLIGPFVGVLIDEWSRRWVLVLSDAVAALGTVALIGLLALDRLELWHIYAIVMVGASAMSVHRPAYQSTVALLLPKKHFARASGMLQFGQSASQVLAPLAAGFLLPLVSLGGIVAIDLLTFLVAMATLLVIAIPKVEKVPAPGPRKSIFAQAAIGWTYIRERPALVSLVLFFAMVNLLFAFSLVLTTPLVLSFAGPPQLGLVLATGSVGALLGSLAMSVWGGPKKPIYGILGFSPVLGLAYLVVGARPSLATVTAGVFLLFLAVPVINASNHAIWQSKVDPRVQGRVFAVSQLVSQFTAPIAFVAAGPLADRVFEPMLAPGGALADSIGRFIGVGEGRGIAFQFLIMGLLLLTVTGSALLYPRLRRLEDEVPDAVPEEASAVV